MKKLLPLFFIIILLLIFFIYRNNDPKVIISRLHEKGEIKKSGELIYRVYLLGILPIGEAFLIPEEIEDYQGYMVYHLRGSARSPKIFSKIFSAYAVIDSYIDMQEFNPLLYREKFMYTGKEEKHKEVIYDQRQGIMSIGGVRRQILPNTQEPLSAIFNIRHLDFDKIKEFEMNINTNQKNYILKGIIQPKNILINNKIYKTVILDIYISRHNENPYHKSRITTILLREKFNLPILIKSFANGILINARLIDIK